MARTLRHAGALALALAASLTAIMGCPFHEESFHRDCAVDKDCGPPVPCVENKCTAGICTSSFTAPDKPCSSASMMVCDGAGHCVECVSYADCQTVSMIKPVCDMKLHQCVSCTDGIQNGKETGVDCGGPDCGACAGAPCVCSAMFTPTDCNNNSDGGVACSTSKPGSDGGACVIHPYGDCGNMTTCASQARNPDNVCCDMPCTGTCMGCVSMITGMPTGTCAPVPYGMDPYMECAQTGTPNAGGCGKSPNTCACNDKVVDGNETDVDCGGGTCPGCGGGKKCNTFTDCTPAFGNCVNGACCAELCGSCSVCGPTGQCMATIGQNSPSCMNGLVCGPIGSVCVAKAGAACVNPGACLSGVCAAGHCATSPSGGPCNTSTDCAAGTTCQNFICM
jgi:hypothetical protein